MKNFTVFSIPHSKQRGAVLVVGLLLLLILTIVSVTSMQMNSSQETMAGNLRDHNLAFQAAESGLRGVKIFWKK